MDHGGDVGGVVIINPSGNRLAGREGSAVVELEEGLAALTSRLPDLRLVGAPPLIRGSGGIRTVDDMRVRWSRRASV